ncbi:serine/threonine-protein kinase [Blastococcus sp. PRF04-17]|uniref:serine/threonine-protein kinase n=1 Tax=Blastococcus sp. PRF04-17 TaxID=2933797 RepID=UPI001FF2E6C2|nr:serine/threonine-protein kinase [Blastococcus sp. PRF04-17]UOY00498.1 serine/threonine protein kinase [Blastococcus sp. PRF04-17]
MTAAAPALLGNRYELCELLATGGMGQVWRARDVLLSREVAVKVLRSEFTGDPTFVARFRAEAQHAAVLAHRNIATVHDYGEAPAGPEEVAYLVMELVHGEALSDLLAREGRLDVERTLDVLRQTAAALAAAHRAGVVHRDVKPGNVLVGVDGVVTITDFGIAWSASSVPLTKTGQVVGTAHYLSPEQAAGGKATSASDVYALGLIGYECLAGRRAFDGENPVQIALRQLREVPGPLPADVPENLRRLIERALVKDPTRRFPDGAAFRDAVDDVRAGRMLPRAPRDGGTHLLPAVGRAATVRRRPLLVPALALLAGAGIAVAASHVLGSPPAAPAVATETGPTTPAAVLLAAGDHVGRPVGEVQAALAALGLAVELIAVETAGSPPGTVTGITPVGAVAVGERIAVSYAVAPPVPAPPSAPASVPTEVAAAVPERPAGETAAGGTAEDEAKGTAKGTAKATAKDRAKGRGGSDEGSGGRGRGNGP